MSPEEALEEVKRCSGTQFDPRIVDIFVALKESQLSRGTKLRQSPVETPT